MLSNFPLLFSDPALDGGNGARRILGVVVWKALGALMAFVALVGPAWGQESSREAALFFSDVVNYQNAGEFELAADEWKKFIEKFPADPLAAKAQNYLAVCQLQLKQYADATTNFETVLKKYPQADFREEALLNLASANYAWAQDGNPAKYQEASRRFAALLQEFPQTEYADQARYFRAESLYQAGQKEEAIDSYRQMIEKHPQSPLIADALYALGVTQEELQQYPQAQKTYDQFLDRFADNRLVTEVVMRKGETLLQQEQYEAAEKLFLEAARTQGFDLADHAWYRLAFCALERDDVLKAGNAYARIPLDFPQSGYAPEATMLAGRCYYRAGRLDDAAQWLAAAQRQGDSYEAEAAHWLARVYLQQGKPDQAESLAVSLIPQVQGSEFLVDLKLDQADAVYQQADRRAESIRLYRQIAQDHPETPEAPQALYNGAFAALEIRDFAQAVALAAALVERYPQDEALLDAMYVAAEAKLQLDRLDEAEHDLQQLIQQGQNRPERPRWQLRLALAQYLQGDYAKVEQTVAAVEPTLQNADLLAQAHYLRGASAFGQQKLAAAQQALEASAAASTNWPQADEARLMLARTLHARQDTTAAIDQTRSIIAEYPESRILDEVHFRLGEFLFAAGQYEPAVEAYRKLRSSWPQSPFVPHALYGEGWAWLQKPDTGEAEKAFSQLISNHRQHPLLIDAHLGRALVRRQAGKYAEAIQDFDVVIAQSDDTVRRWEAEYLKGVSLVDSQKPGEAAEVFAALHERHPDFADDDKVLYELAWAQRSVGDTQQAVARFRELAESYPESPLAAEAMYHVGEAAYAKEQYAEAETWFTSAAGRAQSAEIGEKALYKKAWAHYQQNETQEALNVFGQQISDFPDGPLAADAAFMQGECFYQEKQFEAALTAYQQVNPERLSSDEMRSLLLLHAGQAASQQKQWDEAQRWYTRLLETLPDSPLVPEAHYELGWALYNQQDTPQAVEHFQQAAESSRGLAGARARFMLGEIYFEQKKYDDAVRQFKQVVYGFGGEESLESVKPWQAKSAYEIARCNEVQVRGASPDQRSQHLAEAEKFYQLVVTRFPTAPEAKLAQNRLEALGQL